MRVNTAFNKLLGLEGASVRGVRFAEQGTVCEVALRRRRAACSGCGTEGHPIHGRRRKRWRHLDLGGSRCFIECELRRLRCPGCGVRYEAVPFARAGSAFSADFEDVVCHLAQQMAKTPILALMRIGWRALGGILERVVAERAVDSVRREEWNRHERSATPHGRWIKGTRWALVKAPENRSESQDELLAQVQRTNARLYRAYLLKEELRGLYGAGVDVDAAAAHLDRWLAWAQRSRLRPFVKLQRTIRRHREGLLDAVRIGISNGRVEGLNTKIRLISSRSFGFHSAAPLIALVYLCCGGIEVELPWR